MVHHNYYEIDVAVEKSYSKDDDYSDTVANANCEVPVGEADE